MVLDLKSLTNAIAQLKEALEYCQSDLAKSDEALAVHLRAAAIQAFEFTYELCLKTIRRHLEQSESSVAIVRSMSFDELIRRAWALELLHEDVTQWREFRKQRGTTSHTYNEDKAEIIYQEIPRFLVEAQYLHAAILQRQQSDESNNPH